MKATVQPQDPARTSNISTISFFRIVLKSFLVTAVKFSVDFSARIVVPVLVLLFGNPNTALQALRKKRGVESPLQQDNFPKVFA